MMTLKLKIKELLKRRSIKDIQVFVKWLFPNVKSAQNITYYQAYLVKRIAFSEVKRLSISAFTRYGKSQMVAIAVAIYILINKNKKIKFIGPTDDQAGIIKTYMSELILNSRGDILLNLSELELKEKKERLKAEVSQKRMTFRNGCEYSVVTAHNKGFSAMGKGGDLICFPKGTKITTNKGLINIEDLVNNKELKVLSYNHIKDILEFKPVLEYFKSSCSDLIKISYNGKYLVCSDNHPIYVKGKGYVKALNLCVNDEIYILSDKSNKYDSKLRYLWERVEKTISKIERISKKRIDVYNLCVKDNNNYFADNVLVHNCMDEATLISRESYAKITRMLGDDPENSVLIELYNPWDRNTKAYDHSISPRFERIQIDYKIGIEEDRVTESFIEEQREDLTPLEFCVLYKSEFPEEAEDSLHSLKSIEKSESIEFGFESEVSVLLNKLKNRKQMSEAEFNKCKSELKRYDFRISCDPADKGLDFTTIYWGIVKDKQDYEILGVWSEAKSESMGVVGKVMQKIREFVPEEAFGSVYIDKIGIGTGTESRLRELKNEQGLDNIKIVGCHYGEGANNSKEFMNKKAENHFRVKDLLVGGNVSLKSLKSCKDYVKVKSELLSMKWDITSANKKRIIDPDKSPDFNDGIVYFCWRDKKELVASFI